MVVPRGGVAGPLGFVAGAARPRTAGLRRLAPALASPTTATAPPPPTTARRRAGSSTGWLLHLHDAPLDLVLVDRDGAGRLDVHLLLEPLLQLVQVAALVPLEDV